ncbi:hypothetical protein HBH64_095150 [Parastagonospora nodorum]|nr:hypothetical protein HBH42_130320 [Parastagonospora nodorum]KAH4299498.1 hypothetical protein HBI01_119690 [Parastagonospora nodorum]KAH4329773.1 hypothetical protein HBI00_094800 [Parastagonospora nodorum]KAH4366379.1 hypothetical protein HBH94_150930 [Parastagonospora nodorum]KAH4486656.1 hypothetical protein HBH88_135920 [Parastagonospora nodorum]
MSCLHGTTDIRPSSILKLAFSSQLNSEGAEKAEGQENSEEKIEEKIEDEDKQRSPSPTPSEIVLRADLAYTGLLSDLNAQMMRDGVGVRAGEEEEVDGITSGTCGEEGEGFQEGPGREGPGRKRRRGVRE